ncbi:MAG: molybdopterin-dependent oxidoreductase [Burkholderiales bacterium]|nr:molybdopterin-dependent oxidoreductase [Burkholderiales bacterium]
MENQLATDETPALRRRTLLAYAVSAPVVTVAATLGLAPETAFAALPLTPPDSVDYYDVGDSLVQVGLPTMPLVKLEVGTNGRVLLDLPRLEVGQGIATACGMMVAEELDVPLTMVDVTSADARPELMYNQVSGGSAAVRCFDAALPLMAAALRARLLLAAEQRFGVSASSLVVIDGTVRAPDGRTATYGELSAAASALPVPAGVSPKPPTQYRVVGTAARRLDAYDIVTGRKKFTMDQPVAHAKPTMLRMPSQIRGRVVSVNNIGTVRAMPGVLDVVVIPTGGTIVANPPGVAVMAETFGQAYAGALALDITWGDGPLAGQSDASIQAALKASIAPLAAPPLGALTVEGDFTFAACTHCPLEVECAIADVRADSAEIWAGLQTPIITKQAIAMDLGLPADKVTVHVVPSGGSFGRRLFWDPVQVAAQVSRLTGRACKLMYHRTDDIRQTRLRPPQFHKVRATLVAGQVVSYEQRIAAVRLDARHGYGEWGTASTGSLPAGVSQTVGNMNYEQFFFKTMVASPYNYGVSTKVLTPLDLDMNTVSYRSVHIMPARTCEEIVTDEIARRMGRDAVEFRLEYLRSERARACLQRVAGAANWGRTMPAGFAQGVAAHQESRSYCAAVVEVDARDRSNVKVTKAVIAIDVGKPINLSGIDAQIQGALSEAIAIVLNAGLTIRQGLPLESSYANYRFTKMRDYPRDVQVIVMPNQGQPVGGLGEVGLSVAAGAIANAYARATGIKPRNFPLNPQPAFDTVPPGELPEPVFVS